MPWFWPIGRPNTTRSRGVPRGAPERRAAEPDRLGGDQDALGIQAVQEYAEALAFLADAVFDRHLQAVDEEHVGVHRIAAHLVDLAHLDLGCGRDRCRTGSARAACACTSSSGVVRARISILLATWAVEIQIFAPVTR